MANNDYNGALAASADAEKWANYGIGTGLIFGVLYMIGIVMGA